MTPLQIRKTFVVAWMLLSLAGALNHTIAEKLFGERFDLMLPHLKYGHVMFNKNATTIDVWDFSGPDGVRHPLRDLVQTPAIGYADARVGLDLYTKPDYIRELCFRAFAARKEPLTIFEREYQVEVDPRTPSRTLTLRCDAHGLAPL